MKEQLVANVDSVEQSLNTQSTPRVRKRNQVQKPKPLPKEELKQAGQSKPKPAPNFSAKPAPPVVESREPVVPVEFTPKASEINWRRWAVWGGIGLAVILGLFAWLLYNLSKY